MAMRCGSWPAAASAAGSRKGVPSIHSVVSTRARVRVQSSAGTRKSASSAMLSASSEAAAPSMRRSSSSATEAASVSTSATNRSRRASAENRSAMRAAKRNASKSRANWCSTPGRNTFTATRRGGSSAVQALCTCAIEAAATGGPNSENTASSGAASSSSTMARAAVSENGGRRSCKLSSPRAISGPIMSGRQASNCPALMALGPRLSSAFANRTPGGSAMSARCLRPRMRAANRAEAGIWLANSRGASASNCASVRAMRNRRRMLESVRNIGPSVASIGKRPFTPRPRRARCYILCALLPRPHLIVPQNSHPLPLPPIPRLKYFQIFPTLALFRSLSVLI